MTAFLSALGYNGWILTALLAWVSMKVAAWIRAKTQNEYVAGTLLRLNDSVFTAVKAVAGAPEKIRLSLGGPIPATADHNTGRLNLYFNDGGAGALKDTGGNAMTPVSVPRQHWGNVKDTIGN